MPENSGYIDGFAKAGEAAGRAFEAFHEAFTRHTTGEYKQASTVAARTFLMYYQSVLDNAVDEYGAPTEPEAGGFCAQCWCNTCAQIDTCPSHAATDGITPPPCEECKGRTTPLHPAPCIAYMPGDG